jgi:hypothetical protein
MLSEIDILAYPIARTVKRQQRPAALSATTVKFRLAGHLFRKVTYDPFKA